MSNLIFIKDNDNNVGIGSNMINDIKGNINITQNLNVSGNINLTDGGMVKTTGQGSFGSLSVTSNNQVSNLNAHKLGGNLPSDFATATHNHNNTTITPSAVGINAPLPSGATKLKVNGGIDTQSCLLYFEGSPGSGHYVLPRSSQDQYYARNYIRMQTPQTTTLPELYDSNRDWFIGTRGWSATTNSTSMMLFSTRTHQPGTEIRNVGYVHSNYGTNYGDLMNFTGQHRCVPQNIDFYNNIDNYVGLIVYATGDYKTYSNSQEKLTTDKEAITINDSLPIVDLSNKKKQKSVFGIISNKEEEERIYRAGVFHTPYPNTNDDKRLYINSVGEGAIWIVNTNGNLENGDYIEASVVIGMGEKQDSEFLANYTVAKITCDCNFDTSSTKYNCVEFVDPTSGNTYKKAFVGCSYHCG